jgi:hypothetical protein
MACRLGRLVGLLQDNRVGYPMGAVLGPQTTVQLFLVLVLLLGGTVMSMSFSLLPVFIPSCGASATVPLVVGVVEATLYLLPGLGERPVGSPPSWWGLAGSTYSHCL